jgi:hypothetical protein
MHDDTWAIKNPRGEKVGTIKKLIIDSKTRQITYADLALSESNHVVRIPWSMITVKSHDLFLSLTKEELIASSPSSSHCHEPTEPVSLEVTMTTMGIARPRK